MGVRSESSYPRIPISQLGWSSQMPSGSAWVAGDNYDLSGTCPASTGW